MTQALLVLVAVLLTVILLLLLGLIRRLRVHEELLSGGVAPDGLGVLRPAVSLPDFSVLTTDGHEVSRQTLLTDASKYGSVRVVFFSTACEHCAEVAANLRDTLDQHPSLASGTLVVIFDDADDAKPFLSVLDGRVRTAVRPVGDALIGAFGVAGTPSTHQYGKDGLLLGTRPDVGFTNEPARHA